MTPHINDIPHGSKDSSGPWAIDDQFEADEYYPYYIVSGDGDGHIASVTRWSAEPGVRDSDSLRHARLIAAAPQLLEALEEVYTALGLITDFGTATGENPDMQNRALDKAETAIKAATS